MKDALEVAPEVAAALQNGRPVVALESTIISHGMPYPRNVETAFRVEAEVRRQGAVPATIALLGGKMKAGLTTAEIETLGRQGTAVRKVSRRDLPFLLVSGAAGATTVAATMIIAARAGIRFFATGGIGGVHRDVEHSWDISADLQELAKTSVAVISAGIKSILDLPRTMEYLETMGVPVIGFGTDELPAFYSRESGVVLENRMDDPAGIAAVLRAKWQAGLDGGVLIVNPPPVDVALERSDIDQYIERALEDARRNNVMGKAITPFLLARIEELTGGRSLETNIAFVLHNARLAARLAIAYSQP